MDAEEDNHNKPWHLFTSEDLTKGFNRRKGKKRRMNMNKENVAVQVAQSSLGTQYNSSEEFMFCDDDDSIDQSDDEYLASHDITTDEEQLSDEHRDDSDGIKLQTSKPKSRRAKKLFPSEYASLGGPTAQCSKCHAWMWKEERVNKKVTKGTPIFGLCCKKGEVKLPKPLPTPDYLMQLYNDEIKGPEFQKCIRLYNSMFSFTSTGGNIDHSINNGGGPYVYRLNGQNHHVFGSLIPDDDHTPKFCQLYVYDTANEVNNRLRWLNVKDKQVVDTQVVQGLIKMLDETNELAREFRYARDRFENNDVVDLNVTLKVCKSQSGRENHISASNEVAGIMVGDTDDHDGARDIIIDDKIVGLKRVSYVHPKLMALQYPILFPHGEDGFQADLLFQSADPDLLSRWHW